MLDLPLLRMEENSRAGSRRDREGDQELGSCQLSHAASVRAPSSPQLRTPSDTP